MGKSSKMLNILQIDEYALEHILDYCDYGSLKNLDKTHSYFRRVIRNVTASRRTRDALMCGYRDNPLIAGRTFDNLSNWERLRVAENWRKCRFRHRVFAIPGCISKLHLEKDHLYMSYNDGIHVHNRDEEKVMSLIGDVGIGSKHGNSIANFVKKDNIIFAGNEFRTVFIYEKGRSTKKLVHPTTEKIQSLDFSGDIFVTGTNKTIRIWRRSSDEYTKWLPIIRKYCEGTNIVKFLPSGEKIYLGQYIGEGMKEIDLKTGLNKELGPKSLSVYDIKVKDENIAFTANMDGTFRIYDRRLDADVGKWQEPSSRELYRIEYDGLYGVLCASNFGPAVDLLDLRSVRTSVQRFRPIQRKTRVPPSAFDIACDSRYLFIAIKQNVTVFDFKSEASCGFRKTPIHSVKTCAIL